MYRRKDNELETNGVGWAYNSSRHPLMFWLIHLSRTQQWTRETQTPDEENIFHQNTDNESYSATSNEHPHPIDEVSQKIESRHQSSSGQIGPSNHPNQSSARTGTAFFTRKSVDIADFRSSPDRSSDKAAHQMVTSMTLPPIIGDSKKIAPQKWESLSASERVVLLQRWMMYAEVKYRSPVADWPEAFTREWFVVKHSPSAVQCLIAARHKVAAGESALNYVARVMEGDLPEDVEQWRALYVQTYHMTGIINRACARLQCMIDNALVDNAPVESTP
jgi:hypothetical protein